MEFKDWQLVFRIHEKMYEVINIKKEDVNIRQKNECFFHVYKTISIIALLCLEILLQAEHISRSD